MFPGPIGAILTSQLDGIDQAASLSYASTLCGACYQVCPVKIDIPAVLVHLRGQVVRHKQDNKGLRGKLDPENLAMLALARTLADRRRYERPQRLAQLGQWPLSTAIRRCGLIKAV